MIPTVTLTLHGRTQKTAAQRTNSWPCVRSTVRAVGRLTGAAGAAGPASGGVGGVNRGHQGSSFHTAVWPEERQGHGVQRVLRVEFTKCVLGTTQDRN